MAAVSPFTLRVIALRINTASKPNDSSTLSAFLKTSHALIDADIGNETSLIQVERLGLVLNRLEPQSHLGLVIFSPILECSKNAGRFGPTANERRTLRSGNAVHALTP